jgi:hypothetical protein
LRTAPRCGRKTLAATTPRQCRGEQRLAVRTRERYAAVQQLREQDWSISAISRALSLDRRTARRFTRADPPSR